MSLFTRVIDYCKTLLPGKEEPPIVGIVTTSSKESDGYVIAVSPEAFKQPVFDLNKVTGGPAPIPVLPMSEHPVHDFTRVTEDPSIIVVDQNSATATLRELENASFVTNRNTGTSTCTTANTDMTGNVDFLYTTISNDEPCVPPGLSRFFTEAQVKAHREKKQKAIEKRQRTKKIAKASRKRNRK